MKLGTPGSLTVVCEVGHSRCGVGHSRESHGSLVGLGTPGGSLSGRGVIGDFKI